MTSGSPGRMPSRLPDAVLTPTPGVAWSTEQSGLFVIHEARGLAYHLTGLSEMLWEFLTQQFTYAQILPMLALFHTSSGESVECEVSAILREWQAAGLVVLTENASHG